MVKRIARGADGDGPLRRLYRRSPVRYVIKVLWDHRGLTSNDVVLASYPRSGQLWLRFLIVDMLSGDASIERVHRDAGPVQNSRDASRLVPGGGRLFRTHEPYRRYYNRAIHLVRDPRDVVLSSFRYMQRIGKVVIRPGDDEAASFDRFVSAFLAGRTDAFGTWQSHLWSWSQAAVDGRAQILRIRYEDMRADTPATLMRIAGWLGHPLTMEEASRVVERCSIERMQEAESFAVAQTDFYRGRNVRTELPLVNAGKVEGWRNLLDNRQQERFLPWRADLALLGYEAT